MARKWGKSANCSKNKVLHQMQVKNYTTIPPSAGIYWWCMDCYSVNANCSFPSVMKVRQIILLLIHHVFEADEITKAIEELDKEEDE